MDFLPEQIRNPLLALGLLLLIALVVALVGYISMQYHAWRGHSSTLPADDRMGQVAADRADAGGRRQTTMQSNMQPVVLPLRQWLDRVNHQPDRTPHLAVIGGSGAGKSTLVLAAMHDRPGSFVICTPKNERDDPWGGFPAVRLRKTDMSFEPISTAIGAVYEEMVRRNAQGFERDDWITLIIDDYSTVIGKVPALRDLVLDMVTLGRSVRIRIVLLATERNVEAWGWKGRGEARNNVLFVECALDETDPRHTTRRARMYRWGKEADAILLDIREVGRLATQPWRTRPWMQPEVSTVSNEDTAHASACAVLLTRRVPVAAGDLDTGLDESGDDQSSRALWSSPAQISTTEQAEHPQSAMQSTLQPRNREGLIRLLLHEGWSANDIVKTIKGDSNVLYPLIERIKGEGNL